ncbi:MAG TPA: xanthine dehydrogenase family protein molybdopterin-binding subunit [Xanthobacteraceae bacterium]|jgi:carbon-monoxide dehydrogenase large subunit
MTAHPQWQPRIEDEALLRGRGRFMDDAALPGQCIGAFVRSPHAHARIRKLDIEAARGMPGVLAVLTTADMEKAGVGNVSRCPPLPGKGGKPLHVPFRPALAGERVMHVGQAVALVVAETLLAALDAAERVVVEYEELEAAVDVRAAMAPGAPQLWSEAPGNIAVDWPGFKEDEDNSREVERIIASAPHVARIGVVNQRVAIASIEPRGATASYDKATDTYLLRSCSQGAGTQHAQMIEVMGWSGEKLRLITEDVGGAFGMKTPAYPEYPALLVAARMVGRPVHWMSTRTEAFQSDNQARDTFSEAELALDKAGRILALRAKHTASVGALLSAVGAQISTASFARCLPTVYAIPKIAVEAVCVFTNTVPIGPYRGAGRPEANYMMERLIDEAARVTGLDRVSIRRRNFIPASAMPYKTAVGSTFDSGEFETILDKALKLSGFAKFKQRRKQATKRGKLCGLGISCFLEHSGAQPKESAAIAFPGGEALTVALGMQSTGQGHATVFSRLLAEKLGIGAVQVSVLQGDSRFNLAGYASVGSRSAMTAGTAIVRTSEAMLAKGRSTAAHMLEVAEADIEYRNGSFEVKGTDRRLSLFEVAERAKQLAARGEIKESLDTKLTTDIPTTYPNGCHIAEIEIDPETGVVEIVAYSAVDDCGNVLDHVIVEAQVQGGVAQGVGQALMENFVYEADSGQVQSGTFMDYALPRADDVPSVTGKEHVVPATTNPLGVKGVGEAGTTASLAAVMNAIADAIPGAGAKLDMPATPEKVWRACQTLKKPAPTKKSAAKKKRSR